MLPCSAAFISDFDYGVEHLMGPSAPSPPPPPPPPPLRRPINLRVPSTSTCSSVPPVWSGCLRFFFVTHAVSVSVSALTCAAGLMPKCNFPWLLSNVLDLKSNKLLAGGLETHVIEHNGVPPSHPVVASELLLNPLYSRDRVAWPLTLRADASTRSTAVCPDGASRKAAAPLDGRATLETTARHFR